MVRVTSPSSFSSGWAHDVFLSFRSYGASKNWTDQLRRSLVGKRMKVFIPAELNRGTDFSQIAKAIEQSRELVVVISLKYVSSRWCLDELVKILECEEQFILPVFYGVDRSNILEQAEISRAFDRHKSTYDTDLVQDWKRAVQRVASLSGVVAVRNGGESRSIESSSGESGSVERISGESGSIESIVQNILEKLDSAFQNEESIVDPPPQGADVFSNDVDSLASKIGRQTPKITNWKQAAHVGTGSFASVYEALHEDGFYFAVKEVSLNDKKHLPCLENEIAILKKLDHENIVQYYGTQKDEEKLYLFLELVSHGTVEQAYRSCPFEESQVSQYTQQILQGLKYLHDSNVIHGDLKCANILVNESGKIKLIDFGLSSFIEDGVLLKPRSRSSYWMAPEAANRKSAGYSFPADIWSFGCTVLEMSIRQHPRYDFKNEVQLEFAIANKDKKPIIPDRLSHRLKDFIHECLQPDPNKRPTAAKLLAHPFMNASSCT